MIPKRCMGWMAALLAWVMIAGVEAHAAAETKERDERRETDALVAQADAFGPRLAGAVWVPDGTKLGDSLAAVPMARFLQQIRVAAAVTATGRWLSGLPLPPEAWGRVMEGPTLLVWVRPIEYAAFEKSQSSTLPETGEKNIELAMLVHLDPANPRAGGSLLRWLALEGFFAARERNPDLKAERRRVAGRMLHVWERPDGSDGTRPILAYALRDNLLILAGDERIVSEVLTRTPPPPDTPPSDLALNLLGEISDARALHAPVAGVFDIHTFPMFESAAWIGEGLGIGLVGKVADRLAGADEKTSAALAKAREGMERFGERAATGGISDLRRMAFVYIPDSTLPRSRVRLVFDENAQSWMEEMAAGRPFQLPDLAPPDCVAFWSLRVPGRLLGADAEQGGAEIGRLFVPTEFRVASVWLIEAPRLTAYLRTQMGRVDSFFTTTTLEMPVEIPLSGPWAKVKDALRTIEPWMPLVGVRWKVRLIGDRLAFATSYRAIEKVAAVERLETKPLRVARPALFDPSSSFTLINTLGPGRVAFDRFNDIAWHAESVRALDIVEFPFLSDPGEDAKLFQLNYLALAQKIPKVKEWLSVLPPQHTRVMWYPDARTMEITTQSASGLPGDFRVWVAAATSLIPTFDLDLSGWDEKLDQLKEFDYRQLDPRRWWADDTPPDGEEGGQEALPEAPPDGVPERPPQTQPEAAPHAP